MYIILVYDVDASMVSSIMKICRMFLHHIQNSVFEGSLSDKDYNSLVNYLKSSIDLHRDSILIFKMRTERVFNKEIIGIEKNPVDNVVSFSEVD
jgi:CRISPR-associated protein Cas2